MRAAADILRPFAKRHFLSDFCVPVERDLRFASTGSNFNLRNIPYIPVFEIFAFPRSKSGIFDLNSNKNYHFSKVSFNFKMLPNLFDKAAVFHYRPETRKWKE